MLKKRKKNNSENDQVTGHFQSFFIYFFRPPDPKSDKKILVNQLIKNSGVKGSAVEETVRHILSCDSTTSGLKWENSCFSKGCHNVSTYSHTASVCRYNYLR